MDGNPVDFRSSCLCHARHRDPVVDDPAAVLNDRRGPPRPIKDFGRLLGWQRVPVQVRVAEMIDLDERKRVSA
jgi:hypothetical protein